LKDHLRQLGQRLELFPKSHVDYLKKLRDDLNFEPKVIYDIGACVMHWTNSMKPVWPNAEYILFDGMEAAEFLYQESGYKYNIGVLSDQDNKEVKFYENVEQPGGNSYYQENVAHTFGNCVFPDSTAVAKIAMTLDTIVANKGYPLPDLIKMDVQGAELDIIKGATKMLEHCKHLVLELQHVDFNIGAPSVNEVREYLKTIGFTDVSGMFSSGGLGVDGDYHFVRF